MEKFYITTSIPYVNATPHLGNVLDSVYADVLARYHRQRGADVRFLTGSDEHGVKIARSAAARFAGEPRPSDGREAVPTEIIQRFVDETSAKFRALKETLNLSWDDFIRTSDQQRHWPGAQKLWNALAAQGDLYKKSYKGLYCVGHEAFVTDKDLDNGVCKDHQKKPEIIAEENWFFKLSKYSKEIESRIKNQELRIVPEGKRHEILSLLKEGLEDVSFSRPSKDLSWGVPVPGDPTQTMYVWADALANYISALGYGSTSSPQVDDSEKDFKKYWPADVQVIGKDNLRFHAAIWPGMLLSAGLPLPKTVFVHGFLTVDGQKISKTVGNVIDPVELVKKYGTDPVRYYLLREVSPFEDGDFSYEKFEAAYNGDLANGIGNFSARVLALAEKAGNLAAGKASPEIEAAIQKTREELEEKIGEYKFHEAASVIWGLISFGDSYVNEKKPWQNPDPGVLLDLVTILENVAELLSPFIPGTAEKISKCIVREGKILKIKKGEVLFPRL
ncbi:MAG: methionyl-tRNA synthetase [Parcubacteria group bacterium Gr01-1014_3]|nr:MAG: methionyl-tRNA synthetase [Parcubacteria group bacterium Gr01-1014_3]